MNMNSFWILKIFVKPIVAHVRYIRIYLESVWKSGVFFELNAVRLNSIKTHVEPVTRNDY